MTVAPRSAFMLPIVLLGAVAIGATTLRADEPATQTLLLKAARIYLNPDDVVESAAVLIEHGRISAIGADLTAPEGATIIDVPDGTITAGLIDACASVGFRDPVNRAEHASECVPETRVLDMLDLHSREFDHLARQGVTTVYVTADGASAIGGRGALLRTAGPSEQRIIRDAWGVKATIGREPIFKGAFNRGPFGRVSHLTRRPTTRMGLVWTFRKAFHDAQVVSRGGTPATSGEGAPSEASLNVLTRVVRGEIPLRIQARAQVDILTAIRLSREFNVPFLLEEGTQAFRCIDELKENSVPIIFGPIFDYPGGYRGMTREADGSRMNTATELIKAGLTVALTAADQTGEAALPQQATYAMRHGLTRQQALAATTTTPAALLELADSAGRIEPGRPADIVVWSGEPFDATTRAEAVIIGGRLIASPAAKSEERR